MNPMGLSAMTGIPSGRKKSRAFRRGKGGKGAKPAHTPEQCLAEATAALKAGDLAKAKRHAFEFAQSLPSSKNDMMNVATASPRSERREETKLPEQAEPAGPSSMSKLAAILKARKR